MNWTQTIHGVKRIEIQKTDALSSFFTRTLEITYEDHTGKECTTIMTFFADNQKSLVPVVEG